MATNDEQEASLHDIYEYLNHHLVCAGSPWAGGRACDLPAIPGLQVDGVGAVSLPLTRVQARQLQEIYGSSAMRMGNNTMIRIGAEQVSLRNPEWQSALEQLVYDSAVKLGACPSTIVPELESLLVLGCCSSSNKSDTERVLVVPAAGPVGKTDPRTVASLMVQLPSIFTGGAYSVTIGSQKESLFPFDDKQTPYNSYYVASYPDCQPTLETPTSGSRVSLVYALQYTGDSQEARPSAQKLSQDGLTSLLNRLPQKVPNFCVPVESNVLEELEAGSDLVVAKALEDACAKTNHVWRVAIGGARRWNDQRGFFHRNGRYSSRHGREFEPEYTNRGDPYLSILFRSFDGTEIRETWPDEENALKSLDEGGRLLVPAGDVEEFWGEGDEGSIESEDSGYTFNQEVGREIEFDASVLLVYRASSLDTRPRKRDRSSLGVPTEVIAID